MRFSPLELIDELSMWAPIDAGDLLFCGTPAGVGPMQRGDHVQARLLSEDGTILSELDFPSRLIGVERIRACVEDDPSLVHVVNRECQFGRP